MKASRPKPVSLRPMNQKQRRWFWGFLIAGIMVVFIGWILTIRQLASSIFPGIRSQVDVGLEKASNRLQGVESSVQEKESDFSEAFEQVQKGYQQEKERQQQQNEQTISSETENLQ